MILRVPVHRETCNLYTGASIQSVACCLRAEKKGCYGPRDLRSSVTASVNKNVRDPLHRERARDTEHRCLANVFCAECGQG